MSSSASKAGGFSSEALIQRVCTIVADRTGVQLGVKQSNMVESRLKRRMIELGLNSFEEYHHHFEKNKEAETEALVSLLTTHHTYFFREFVQFEFLESSLPSLVEKVKARGGNSLEVWSAACSRGQEVYSLAMHLNHHLKMVSPSMGFNILGSDVDSESVRIAENGVYRRDEIKEIPLTYLSDHWARGTGEIADFVKAKKTLRDHCKFVTANLLDLKNIQGKKFDVIFCRNVFIYFTFEQIKMITNNLLKHLNPGGILMVGLSESLHGQGIPVKAIGPSIYAKEDDLKSTEAKKVSVGAPATKVAPAPTKAPAPAALKIPNPLRVVCIDDSPSILGIMKKVLSKEHGFEVVGTGGNGEEGAKAVADLKPDLVTLDIHMPVCTGLEYLQKHHSKSKPPVVMVSSVSREDANLAWKALSLGASDYVEKPALNNLTQRAEEIRTKLKAAYRSKAMQVAAGPSKLDKEFLKRQAVSQPEKCARLVLFSIADMERCVSLLKEVRDTKVPVYLALEGVESLVQDIAARISTSAGVKVENLSSPTKLEAGKFYLGDLKTAVAALSSHAKSTSVMVIGEVSQSGAQEVIKLHGSHLVLEDIDSGKGTSSLQEVANDVVPVTSFAYLSDEFLSKGAKG